MSTLLAQGGNWDIRSLIHNTGLWIPGFMIAFVLSGVLVYFKLRGPRDESAAVSKNT